MKRSFIAIAIVSGLVLGGIVGFGGNAMLANSGVKSNQDGKTTVMEKPTGVITTIDAKSIILNKVPAGIITNFTFTNSTTPSYDATVVNGKNEYKVVVDAKTGDISTFDTISSDFKGNVLDISAPTSSIPPSTALKIAQEKIPDSTLSGISFNYEGLNTPEYDIVLSTKSAINYICVSAKNGDIISNNSVPITTK